MRQRNSNIELLRIISMLLIVMHHYSLYCLGRGMEDTFNRYFAGTIIVGGKLGNDLFILISGYYMSNTRFTGRKLARIWGQVFFYSVVIYTFFYLLQFTGHAWILEKQGIDISVSQFVKAIFPIGSNQYWFARVYLVLMLMTPVLNAALDRLDRQQLLEIIVFFLAFWSVANTFTSYDYGCNEYLWFALLYMIAGYIRRYMSDQFRWRDVILTVSSLLLMILTSLVRIYIGRTYGIESMDGNSDYYLSMYSPITLLCAVSLLLTFIRMKARYHKVVNVIASATMGVYLIHENPLMRMFLWQYLLLLGGSIAESRHIVLYSILAVAGVYVVCTIIDICRQQTFERWYMAAVNYMEPGAHRLYVTGIDCIAKAIRHTFG